VKKIDIAIYKYINTKLVNKSKKYHFLSKINNYEMIKQVSYYSNLGLSFSRIAKSGSTNMSLILCLIDSNDSKCKYDSGRFYSKIPTIELGARFTNTFRRIIKLSSMNDEFGKVDQSIKITLVRNPYTRALSMFRDKVLKKEVLVPFRVEDSPDGFKRFLLYLLDNGTNTNKHFMLQTNSLFFSLSSYDSIMKIETFASDFILFAEKYGIKIENEIAKRLEENNSKHATNSSSLVHKYYDQKSKYLVYKIYKDDFIQFDYSSELTL
jgi:hypothetical protein